MNQTTIQNYFPEPKENSFCVENVCFDNKDMSLLAQLLDKLAALLKVMPSV